MFLMFTGNIFNKIALCIAYHHREEEGDLFDGLEDPHEDHTKDLYGCKYVNLAYWHMSQIDVVRLVLARHEEDEDTLYELVINIRESGEMY